MKMVLQKVLLCCVLAALLPCVLTAALQLNSDGENKLSVWLQSRWRRELCDPDSLEDSAELVSQQNEDTESHDHKHSAQSKRLKRSCKLLTCFVHDLADRIKHISSTSNSAPQEKLSPHGYGRRRRRSLANSPSNLISTQDRLKLTWLQAQRPGAAQKWT